MTPLIAPIRQFARQAEGTGVKIDPEVLQYLQDKVMADLPDDGSVGVQDVLNNIVQAYGDGNPAMAYVQLRGQKLQIEMKAVRMLADSIDNKLETVAADHYIHAAGAWAEAPRDLKDEVIRLYHGLNELKEQVASMPLRIANALKAELSELGKFVENQPYLTHAMTMAEYEVNPQQVLTRKMVNGPRV